MSVEEEPDYRRETGRGVDADAQYSENGGDGGAGEAVHVPLLESDVDRQVADAGSATIHSPGDCRIPATSR